jgi:alpha-L-rhamnosidase
VTAHGLYEMEINGLRVGDDALSPGWTVYGQRLRYYTYDVTDQLAEGENALGAWLGDGWYRGRIGFNGGHANLYGDKVALLAQLHVTHDDGSVTVVGTDQSWKASFGPILFSSLYKGEIFDARELADGWSRPGFDDSGWQPVVGVERDPATLVAPEGPPVRCTGEVRPVTVRTSPSGKVLLDFGQNLVGRLQITVSGEAGSVVTLRHAEVLQDGELYTRPLRLADSTDRYTLAGAGTETWEPRFTLHGFRYAEIDGWTGGDAAENVVARVYHTDMERTGWFECSDPDLNRLHDNVLWSMKGNFVDIPTDCPQRDERLGWTGDIQVFAPTASFLYDCSGMLSSWLKDVAAEQLPDGTVPWYVPVIPGGNYWTPIRPGAVWGDVAVLTPWALYERFSDAKVLSDQYESAKAWVDLLDGLAGDSHLWDTGFQLGDWLDPTAPPEDPTQAMTDKHLVASAYFAWSTRHLAKAAGVLGRAADELHYLELARAAAEAFAREYIRPDGRMTSDAQTAYALAIVFGLYPDEELARKGGERLAQLVREGGNRIGTGFAGTPVISDALTATGAVDTAYDLLLEKECPSWLYAVKQGGTTIWERWDSMLADGTINPGEMTSFNHYALGAVADWMHRVVAGIAPLEPGYRRILFSDAGLRLPEQLALRVRAVADTLRVSLPLRVTGGSVPTVCHRLPAQPATRACGRASRRRAPDSGDRQPAPGNRNGEAGRRPRRRVMGTPHPGAHTSKEIEAELASRRAGRVEARPTSRPAHRVCRRRREPPAPTSEQVRSEHPRSHPMRASNVRRRVAKARSSAEPGAVSATRT